jgi:hypothetical protein
METKQIGDKTHFTFGDDVWVNKEKRAVPRNYELQEILDKPNISMWWKWSSGICPHCKRKIERDIKHEFYKIKIFVACDLDATEDNWVARSNPTLDDLIVLGYTLDNRKMFVPRNKTDTHNEILQKSKKFNNLVGG